MNAKSRSLKIFFDGLIFDTTLKLSLLKILLSTFCSNKELKLLVILLKLSPFNFDASINLKFFFLDKILIALEKKYMSSGVNLYTISNSYAFRTSSEVSEYLNIERIVPKPLSRAATETLAIIAYHQPITRSEIENIRGVSLSRGTIDLLLELGWIKPGQRRATPGNHLTWKTSNNFLEHFGIKEINELPGIEDLKSSGLLDKNKIIFIDLKLHDIPNTISSTFNSLKDYKNLNLNQVLMIQHQYQ